MNPNAAVVKELQCAKEERDFPDYLAQKIERVLDEHPALLAQHPELCEELLWQLREYDTFAQTGYLGKGATHACVERTLKLLLEA